MTKFDPTNEDEETEAARWQGYVDSYVLVSFSLYTYRYYDNELMSGRHIVQRDYHRELMSPY